MVAQQLRSAAYLFMMLHAGTGVTANLQEDGQQRT
jgi:hypothetical protein